MKHNWYFLNFAELFVIFKNNYFFLMKFCLKTFKILDKILFVNLKLENAFTTLKFSEIVVQVVDIKKWVIIGCRIGFVFIILFFL